MNLRDRIADVLGRRSLLTVWVGVLVLACAWTRALPVFVPPSPHAWIWFACGAVLLVTGCGVSATGPRSLSRLDALLCAAAGITGILLLDRPYTWGPWALVASATLALVPRIGWLRRGLLPGLWTTAVVLTLQVALLPLLYILFSRLHEIPLLAPLMQASLAPLAPDTMRTGAVVHLATATDSIPLTPSWEKLGALPGALALAGFIVVSGLQPNGRQRWLGFTIVTLVFGWVRLVALFLIVSRFRNANVFWEPNLLFVGMLAWPLALAAWWRAGAPEPAAAHQTSHAGLAPVPSVRLHAVAAGVLLATGAALFFGRADPGTRKAGRVLIDESHSDWEWTTEAFDTAWYGGKAGYNYYCLADYWNRYYTVETRREPVTPALLAGFDVVVLKTPTEAYAPAEVEAIVDFVRRGGGLFLIGDHTNVFGSSTFLNPIAERFGMYFRYDATYNLRNLDLSLWDPPAVLPHPITRDIQHFLFATSCSIDTPLFSENVVLGYGIRAMYLDYAELSYFPTKEGKHDYLFPILVQMGGVRYGKGRVLGFTDSTTLSNFFMFVPGKPELALGSLEWLNRSNGPRFWRWLAVALGLGGLALAVQSVRRTPLAHVLPGFLAGGCVAFAIVAAGCERAAARAYPPPAPRQSLDEVVFDGEHGAYVLPTTALLGMTWNNMHTFFVWVQRLGLVPHEVRRLEDAAARPPRVVVEVNPARPFAIPEIDWFVNFVRRGGVLIVMDTPENTASSSSQLLGAFGLGFAPVPATNVAVMRPRGAAGAWLQGAVPGDTLWVVQRAHAVTGGNPLLMLPNGTTVAASREFERGRIIALGVSRMFGADVMGSTAAEPTPRMRAVYQAEYDLFERVAGVRATTRYGGAPGAVQAPARAAAP